MPNWCDNRLEVYYKNEEEKQYVLEMIKAFENKNLLNFIKPMPKHQPDLNKPNPFLAEGGLGSKEENEFGDNTWYSWSNNHWGTKWEVDFGDVDLYEGIAVFRFQSAWAPPTRAFSNFTLPFKLEYFESGWGFYGICEKVSHTSELVDKSADIRFSAKFNDLEDIEYELREMASRDGIDDDIVENLSMADCFYNEEWTDEEDAKQLTT
jgi:hypothetical protein